MAVLVLLLQYQLSVICTLSVFTLTSLQDAVVPTHEHREAPVSSFPNRKSSPRAESGHRRKRVCFDAAGAASNVRLHFSGNVLTVTDIMSAVESRAESCAAEEALRANKRKISLSR